MKFMPILSEGVACPFSVPWDLVAPHRRAVERAAGCVMEDVAKNGGLTCSELSALLGLQATGPQEAAEAVARLLATQEPVLIAGDDGKPWDEWEGEP